MHVTNREAEQWNRVQQAATLRKLEQARMDAVKQILEARKPGKAEQKPVAVKQGVLFV